MDFALTAIVQQHQEMGDFQGLSLLVCLPLLERGEGRGGGRAGVERRGKFPGPFPPVVHLEFYLCRSSIMERGGGRGWSLS